MPTSTKTIKDLTPITVLSGSDVVPIYHSGATGSTSLSTIYGYLSSGLKSDTTFVSTPATNSVTSEKIVANSITSEKIVTNAISTDKIQSNAVTADKIATNAISTTKIVDSAITTVKIADAAITTEKIANNSITSDKISNSSITTAKIADSAITTEKIANNSITTAKMADGSVTLAKLNADVVNTNKGLEKTTSGIGIKLAAGGGLQFNTSGELKLTPPAESSTVVVVRPSDAGSTDVFVGRTAVNGELKPYFKTLIVAANWARTNLTGNVTIFVDEDTVEGSGGQANSYGVDEFNCLVRFITQDKVDSINCLKGKGFKAGLYVWAKDTSKPINGQLWWNDGLSNQNKSAITYIRPRYNRNGVWTDDRMFTEAPRAINYNIYISCNKNLVAPANSDAASDTHFGNDGNNWSNFTGLNNTNISQFYARSAALMEGSRMELRNLNIVQRYNGPDITTLWATTNSQVFLYNMTISLLGKGHYNYTPIWCTDNSEMRIHGMSTLASDEAGSSVRYPGYGIAIVGNKPTTTNKDLATKLNDVLKSENGAWLRQMDWNPFKINDSLITTSIIMDGDFILNAGVFMGVYWGSKYEGFPVLIGNNLNLLPDRFTYDGSGNLSWNNTNGNIIPFNHNKNCDIRFYHRNSPLRKYVLNGGSDDTGKVPYGFPSKFNGINVDWGVGTFKNAAGNNASNTSPATTFTLRTTVNDVDNLTTGYYFDGITYPNYPYIEAANLPSIAGFYTFTENGRTKVLNYGASVRN